MRLDIAPTVVDGEVDAGIHHYRTEAGGDGLLLHGLEIETGIGECDLVRLKGRPPTAVLVGEGRAGREVQVLYTEPGAKELYFFVNNRLDRIVR